jgi:hypothetical protein
MKQRRIDPNIPGGPPWLPRLIAQINRVISDIPDPQATPQGRAVGRGLVCYVDLIEFSVPENVEDAFPLFLEHDLPVKPREVRVAAATNLTIPGGVNVSAVYPSWEMAADGRVAIRHVSGLVAFCDYRLTFAVQA